MKKGIAVLGATGSIGKQTIELLNSKFQAKYKTIGLASNSNTEDLMDYAIKLNAEKIIVANPKQEIKKTNPEFSYGKEEIAKLVSNKSVDLVVMAIPGTAAIEATYLALKNGKTVALANKESIVAAGEKILETEKKYSGQIIPIDSEHNSIFRLLNNSRNNQNVSRLTITASGGPFLGKKISDLEKVTPKEALKHPSWSMGKLVSINSATLMNKGLEIIEASILFDMPINKIDAVIHPESKIHAMVHWKDGSSSMLVNPPSMSYAINHALSYPDQPIQDSNTLETSFDGGFKLQKLNENLYPCYKLAREAGTKGNGHPIVLNASNEVAVSNFLEGKISFNKIPKVIEKTLTGMEFEIPEKIDIKDVLYIDTQSRIFASNLIKMRKI
ncbi:1-deoxy-D-xylulose-5-phosphate reductoisomerase [bacterium]|nr:1-deoxy-D-xylulose-5-phosphate reductoisomerase [bacterium]